MQKGDRAKAKRSSRAHYMTKSEDQRKIQGDCRGRIVDGREGRLFPGKDGGEKSHGCVCGGRRGVQLSCGARVLRTFGARVQTRGAHFLIGGYRLLL